MECPLCSNHKTHKHGKTTIGSQGYYCPACRQTFTDTFDTLYYRRQIKPEKIRTVLHVEGSSLRGVSRTANLAYNTVVNLIRAASIRGQLIHNAHVQQIETTPISGEESWSFVKKNRSTVSYKSKNKGTAGLVKVVNTLSVQPYFLGENNIIILRPSLLGAC